MENIQKEVTNKHKTSKILIMILAGVIILAIGLFAGLSAARFGGGKLKNNLAFGRNNSALMMRGRMMEKGSYAKGRINGTISKIDGNNLTVSSNNNQQIQVAILDSTSIYNKQGIDSLTDLKTGVKVVIAGRSEEKGTQIAKRLGSNVVYQRTDVTSEQEIKALIDAAVARFGGRVSHVSRIVWQISEISIFRCGVLEADVDSCLWVGDLGVLIFQGPQ